MSVLLCCPNYMGTTHHLFFVMLMEGWLWYPNYMGTTHKFRTLVNNYFKKWVIWQFHNEVCIATILSHTCHKLVDKNTLECVYIVCTECLSIYTTCTSYIWSFYMYALFIDSSDNWTQEGLSVPTTFISCKYHK